MMNNVQVTQLLGLAARARKVISGEELVVKEIRNGNAKLVLLASDAAGNSSKKYINKFSISISNNRNKWKYNMEKFKIY